MSEPSLSEHWDRRYRQTGSTQVSWFQTDPYVSLRLIGYLGVREDAPIVDIGGGASLLVDRLGQRGYQDLTVVDLSTQAVLEARSRMANPSIEWIVKDIREWKPARTFELWHDRATLHFLVTEADRRRYWLTASNHVALGGHVVVGVFAEDGPESCSGLPVQRYDFNALALAMGPGFEVVRQERERHTTPSGAEQSFIWVVARRIELA